MRAIFIFLLLTTSTAFAGTRSQHWSGFDLALGEPFPAIAGLQLGFNVGDDARIGVGTGLFGPWAIYNLDTKIFFSAEEWSAYFGAGLDYMVGQHERFLFWDLQFDRAFVPYVETGLDYQSAVGIHVNFNLGASAPNGRVIVMPGIAIGWYF